MHPCACVSVWICPCAHVWYNALLCTVHIKFAVLQDSARRIAQVVSEAKLPIEEDLYVSSFKPHLMDVVHAWASGAPFSQLCKMTDVFEGSIIRCIRRLEELLRQMCQAAKAIGNAELEKKFEEGNSMSAMN